MDRDSAIREIFQRRRALIGVIHVDALPGTPRGGRAVTDVARRAAGEARLYHDAGFDGLLIENMHDLPYLKRCVGPEITAAMAFIGGQVRQASDLPLGVQILAGANREALAVAHACSAAFVRVEGFAFAHVADEGLIEADAGELLRYRRAIGAESVKVFADIKKKHSSHAVTADLDLVETARAAAFFLADGVVVTGTSTGRPTAAGDVEAVSAAVSVPTLVGSGVNADNVADYAAADALIVGSWVKYDGHWTGGVDPARAAALAGAFRALDDD